MLEQLLSISSAVAQESATGAAGAAAQNPLTGFLPFIVIFFIFYFLMIRPQKKKFQEEQTMLKALTKGDEVFTKSGLIGVIAGMTDRVVTLEISEGVKVKMLREQVGGKAAKLFEEAKKEIKKIENKKEDKKDSKK